MSRLEHIVQLLARPIEYASRNSSALQSTVKNLGPFVSRRIMQALADEIYPPGVETDLLALRQLFNDYDEGLALMERKRRLAGAKAILDRLRATPLTPGPSPIASDLWNLPVRFARGVGPQRAAWLEKLAVHTVEDALWFLPWRYEDRSIRTAIGDLAPGARATICGLIRHSDLKRTARRRMTILDVTVEDSSGDLRAVYFNQPYLEKLFKPGSRVMMSGMVSAGRKGWTDLRMDAPQYEMLGEDDDTPLHVGRIVPIYHETRGFTSRQIRTLMKGLIDQYGIGLEEILPGSVRTRHQLPTIQTAIADVHFPQPQTDLEALERGTTPAHRRLAFEELFVLQLALALRQRSVKQETKRLRFDTATPLVSQVRALLPFRLTDAQERVLTEIQRDMASSRPMNRLLQGDVGCGKTVVAFIAMLIACGSGYQAALMVPTEILAEQHYHNLRTLIAALGLRVALLTSGGSAKARAAALKQIETGEANMVIGTHALIQKGVRFAQLGLAVIDEQHKFGVLQRKTLLEKGLHPEVLVLTATPIPRTLAMTVYGDLDVSVIDALPPGRRPVRTWVFNEPQRRRAYQLLHDEVRAGRQAYIVYPLVEESEKVDLRAAIQAVERLQVMFRSVRVGLLHGRMKAEERARTMAAFKAGEIQMLVATTVIEVGVDVPNAAVMLVEHADRFGLAQLHQLRGRVGRGAQQSICLLLTSGGSEEGVKEQRRRKSGGGSSSLAGQRLEALVKSTDGFVIAEEDLRIRGPGEFFGVRQWGMPEFRAANLVRDAAILEQARQEAFALVQADPSLGDPRHQALRAVMLRRWKAKLDLGAVS